MWISDKIQHTFSSKYPVSSFLCTWSQPHTFSGLLETFPSNSPCCAGRVQAGHFLLKPPSFQVSSSWTCFPGTHIYASHLRSSFISLNVLQALEAQGARAVHRAAVRPVTHPTGNTFDRAHRGIFIRQMHACYFSWESRRHTTLQSSSPCTKSETDASWILALHLSLVAPSLTWSAYVWSYKRLSIFMS